MGLRAFSSWLIQRPHAYIKNKRILWLKVEKNNIAKIVSMFHGFVISKKG